MSDLSDYRGALVRKLEEIKAEINLNSDLPEDVISKLVDDLAPVESTLLATGDDNFSAFFESAPFNHDLGYAKGLSIALKLLDGELA